MKVVLFFAALYLSGPAAESPKGFEKAQDCNAYLAKLPAKIAQWNSDNEDKIVSFAAACVPLKATKQGIAG